MTITDQTEASQNASIDKERLRQKYLEERNKRLRPDGNDQYLQVAGQLAHYLDDPYTPVTPRDPKTDHVTSAFIGGSFAGLATAARLSEAGVRDVRIIEKGGDGPAARLNVGHPAGPMAYFKYIDGWRNSGQFEGLQFR